MVEGPRTVEELLTGQWGQPLEIYLDARLSAERTARFRELARKRDIPEVIVTSNALESVTDTVQSQGVLALASIPEPDLAELLSSARLLLILDGVQDPGNVGTLIRLAEGTGVDGVIALTGTCDPYSSKAVRASAGGLFHVPVLKRFDSIIVDSVQEAGFMVTTLTPEGTPYQEKLDLLLNRRLALVA
ncbi:MAG: RNA methyltransferase, partial [bacterium]|nr:RNA methyltransferase [bacterium]